MTKQIVLSNSNEVVLVDDEEFETLSQWKWSLHTEGYAVRYKSGKAIWMHREIVSVPVGMLPDHIDGNPMNNQRSNLRFVTPAQNTWNTKKADGTSSKYKGVSWHKTKKRWQAQIMKHGKSYHLGHFMTEIEAAQAYAAMKKSCTENMVDCKLFDFLANFLQIKKQL